MATATNAINEATTGICGFTGTAFTATAVTNHAIIVGGATSSALTNIAATATTGQVLQNNASADPSYSTATYPSVATGTGTLLRADGTNWSATTSTYPNTNAVSTLLYASSANVMSALATANGGVLVTSNSGVPSILAGSGTSGQVLQAVSGGAPAWSTPTYPSASGSTGVILRSDGTNYVATTSTYPNTNAVSTLLYASSANVMSALATANSAILNTNSSGVPSITASPTIGANNAATLVTIASNSATALALDNGVAHGTIPLIDLYHDAATVANDFSYEIDFNAQNSTPAKKLFASIQGKVAVNTASSEMGQVVVNTINAGSSQVNITVGNNLGQYRGTQTNTVSPAGFIGEVLSSTVANNSVSLTTGTNTQITSLSITAGNWMVFGTVAFVPSAGINLNQAGINATTATFTTAGVDYSSEDNTAIASAVTINTPIQILSLSGSTNYFLNAAAQFSGTCTAGGKIIAVRL